MTVAATDVRALCEGAVASVSGDRVVEVLRLLAATPSPPGGERPLAEAIAAMGRREHPEIDWDVDALSDASASLVARTGTGGRELAIYSHLDTSLTGDTARDSSITGERAAAGSIAMDDRNARGFGVGVAKAPSASGVVAFLTAAGALREARIPHRLTLLLAAGGTHRADPATRRFGRGVTALLAGGWRPDAVLNVKGGPEGVLYEEPASAYLRVRLRRPFAAALARATAAPDGGLARQAARVMDAIEEWRAEYLRAHPPAGQLASEIAIGSVRAGSPEKADLLPGALDISVYAVLAPEEDIAHVGRDLEASLRARCAGVAPAIDVDVYAYAPGGRADPNGGLIRLARQAYAARIGGAPAVAGWTGATDGGTFLSAGIPTARLGVRVARDETDPRVEVVSLDGLFAYTRAYVEIAIRYAAGEAA